MTRLAIVAGIAFVLFAGEKSPALQSDRSERTPIFTCGKDQLLPNAIPLRWGTIVLAGDGRLFVPCPHPDRAFVIDEDPNDSVSPPTPELAMHRESREAVLLWATARVLVTTQNPEVVWRAVQARARLRRPVGGLSKVFGAVKTVAACNARVQTGGTGVSQERWHPGPLFVQMRSPNVASRKEAAYGLAMKLAETDAALIPYALEELRACLERESDPEIDGLILEAFGVTRYVNDEQRAETEALLVAVSRSKDYLRMLGAAKGLEALLRLRANRPIADATRERLRELAVYGIRGSSTEIQDADARIRRLAMMALQTARDTDVDTLRRAATDADWQVRRLAAMRLNLANPEHAGFVEMFREEQAFQVRYELVGAMSRVASTTGDCGPLVERFRDPAPLVATRAMDSVTAKCANLDDVVEALVKFASRIERPEGSGTWHLPSRALTALSRVKPEEARSRLEAAAKYDVWQVRAAAAGMCVALDAADVAIRLAKDAHPNVRTAALQALSGLKNAGVVPAAIDALQHGEDHQLLMTAANVLRGTPAEAKDDVSTALLGALRRLTESESDIARDPRVAILQRLAETLPRERSGELLPYVTDFDDAVIEAAGKAFQSLVGSPPGQGPLRRRYPYQPTEEMLSALPREATILLAEGSVTIELLPTVAPVTIARFTELARRGAYDGNTFHRIAPNFVVQGGSPGANEYSGVTSRYMRDEVGPQASHIRGAVGISTRGRDTGDGQIFIDLVDNPRLDRDYTVFGYVRSGMELVDRMLEGALIKSVTVK